MSVPVMYESPCMLYVVYMLEYMHLLSHAYGLTAINSVSRSTDTQTHIYHIIGICPSTNMPATLYLYFPLHVYYTLHIDPA